MLQKHLMKNNFILQNFIKRNLMVLHLEDLFLLLIVCGVCVYLSVGIGMCLSVGIGMCIWVQVPLEPRGAGTLQNWSHRKM